MPLEVDSVSVRFGGLLALDGVSLDASDGRVTGLIGPNGAGKTTLFNVITGLQSPTEGSVRLDGRNLVGLQPFRRSRLGMGRAFQRLELFEALSVRENILLAAAIHRRWSRSRGESPSAVAQMILERLGLLSIADVLSDGLPTGQGRLVELGRALAAQPRLLLLDEPASGQDETETRHFSLVVRELAAEGMAVLLVEHDMDLVMGVCERILVLDFGRLVASGTPDQVRANPLVMAAYLGTEAPST